MKITSNKGFAGIDERIGLQNTVSAAAVSDNFFITSDGSLAKRPGEKVVHQFAGDISGIWNGDISGETMLVVASAGELYRLHPSETGEIPQHIGSIGGGRCIMFEFNGRLYIKTPVSYHKYDGEALELVEGYIPTVAINCSCDGGGELYEQINLISDYRRVLISPDGEKTLYKLIENGIESIYSVLLNGKDMSSGYHFDAEKSEISFINPPAEGINTLEIVYRKPTSDSDKERIMKCTRIMLFGGNSDGRAFFWGNPDLPNYRFHSDLANGVPSVEYFPVNAYTVIGRSAINCIVQQYDRQLIFTKDEAFYSYSELRTDSLGNSYSSFPVFGLNGSKGCLFESDGCVVDNRPVTLCGDGINLWESTSVLNEKNAVCISGPIQKSLSNEMSNGLISPKIFDFQANRELFFVNGTNAYIYNYGNGNWYRYTDFPCECYAINGEKLFLAQNSTLYVLSNSNEPMPLQTCVWKSVPISCGNADGMCDITSFCADVYAKGEVTLKIAFESENRKRTERFLKFPKDFDSSCRVAFRPAVKRTMPFSLEISVYGSGICNLNGACIEARKKERSRRFGIL